MPEPRARSPGYINENLEERNHLLERNNKLKNQVERLIKICKDLKAYSQIKVPTKKDWYKFIDTITDPYQCDPLISRLAARQKQLKDEQGINYKSHTPKEIKVL